MEFHGGPWGVHWGQVVSSRKDQLAKISVDAVLAVTPDIRGWGGCILFINLGWLIYIYIDIVCEQIYEIFGDWSTPAFLG